MAIGTTKNFPGPYQCRFRYTGNYASVTLNHLMQLNCAVDGSPSPGTAFSAINLVGSTGGLSALDTEVDALWTIMAPMFNSGSTAFGLVELWKFEAGTEQADFVSSYQTAVTPSSGTAIYPASENIYTFRTTEGGLMKVYTEETIYTPATPKGYAALTGDQQNFVDNFASGVAATFWLGKDTSYPFNFIQLLSGQNEAVFKKRYRP